MSSVNGDDVPEPGNIGQLLWAAMQRARAEGMAALAADTDVLGPLTASHARLLDRLPSTGARVTDLAAHTRITKQALGQLVAQLADRGYVELVADGRDRRAKIIRCTPRGEQARRAIRGAAAALEEQWRSEVGDARYAVFREVLAELGGARRRAGTDVDTSSTTAAHS